MATVVNIFDHEEFEAGENLTVACSEVLNSMHGDDLVSVVVMGVNKDGDLIGSSSVGIDSSITLLERGKQKLIESFKDLS